MEEEAKSERATEDENNESSLQREMAVDQSRMGKTGVCGRVKSSSSSELGLMLVLEEN